MARLQEQFVFDHRYKLKKKLGEGGFSEVWLAEDLSTGVVLVLKVYMPVSKLDEYGLESFRKEYALVFGLNHPNLMKYTYFGICVGNPYLVMPYYDSGSAEDMIGNCSERNAWIFLKDVANGLACLHEQHPAIIHQDIKPANVLLDGRNFVITDFGISGSVAMRVMGENKDNLPNVGTVPYMAPERFSGSGQALIASDIWSLGASLYEMLSGKLPFGNDGGKAQNNGAELEPLSDRFSEELRNVIYQCMSIKPVDRPFAEDLSNFASQQLEQVRMSSISISNKQGFKNSHSGSEKKKLLKIVTIFAVVLAVVATGMFGIHVINQKKQQKKQEAFEAAINNYQEGVNLCGLGKKNGEEQLAYFEQALSKFDEAQINEDFCTSVFADSVDYYKEVMYQCCQSEINNNSSIARYDDAERKRLIQYDNLSKKIKKQEIPNLKGKKH